MPLSRQSVGIYQETSSCATHQDTLGYSRPSSLSHCELILAERVELVCELISALKKKTLAGMNYRTFSQNPLMRGKSHHHHHHISSVELWQTETIMPLKALLLFPALQLIFRTYSLVFSCKEA